MEVQVTFLMEADEPEHSIGLSTDTYEAVDSAITSLGGYDIDFEKIEPVVGSDNASLPKKGM